MSAANNKKIFTIYIGAIVMLAIAIFAIGGFGLYPLIGLGLGTLASTINFFLLHPMMGSLLQGRYFISVQCYIVRLLVYLISAYFSVRIGTLGAVSFALAVIAMTIAISFTYITGGTNQND